MNKNIKSFLGLALATVFVFSSTFIVDAKGTSSISVSKETLAVGDTTDVTVSTSDEGTVTVKYTGSLLSLENCDAEGYTSEGNTITFKGTDANIKFSAKSEGTASIIISSSSCGGSSTTVSISGIADPAVATAAEAQDESASEGTDEAPSEDTVVSAPSGVGVLNDAGGFTIDGVDYVISEKFSDSQVLKGFSKQTVSIAGHTYGEPTNGSVVLLYLKPADNTAGDGVFYLYDEEAQTVTKFQYVGTASNYVVLSETTAPPSTSMTAGILNTDTCSQVVYTIEGSEFYYFYGVNQDGLEGWYQYDSTYDVVSRADIVALATVGNAEMAEEDMGTSTYSPVESYQIKLEKFRKIVSALVVVCVLLVFCLINMKFGKGRKIEDEEEEDVFDKPIARPSKQMRKSIVFSSDDVEDDGDTEDDEEADDSKELKSHRNDSDSDLEMIDLNDL